ncbi:hypothetical protein SUDANB25_05807 [Streptomyces sp. SudanB25_2051]
MSHPRPGLRGKPNDSERLRRNRKGHRTGRGVRRLDARTPPGRGKAQLHHHRAAEPNAVPGCHRAGEHHLRRPQRQTTPTLGDCRAHRLGAGRRARGGRVPGTLETRRRRPLHHTRPAHKAKRPTALPPTPSGGRITRHTRPAHKAKRPTALPPTPSGGRITRPCPTGSGRPKTHPALDAGHGDCRPAPAGLGRHRDPHQHHRHHRHHRYPSPGHLGHPRSRPLRQLTHRQVDQQRPHQDGANSQHRLAGPQTADRQDAPDRLLTDRVDAAEGHRHQRHRPG